MRDGLRFMPEGSGKFEVVVWARRDGEEAVVSGRCGTVCWMTIDTEHPPYIFAEPRVGYRMAKGEGEGP